MRRCEYLTLLIPIAIRHICGNLFIVGNGLVGTTLILAGQSLSVLSPAVPLHHLAHCSSGPFYYGFLGYRRRGGAFSFSRHPMVR